MIYNSGIMSIYRHIVVISGFRQKHGRATTGVDEIWSQVHRDHVGPDCAVHLKCWDDDFRSLAALINKERDIDLEVEVEIIAYSWGVGVGAIKLARELQQYDIIVNRIFSIDGVYSSKFWSFQWRSMLPRWSRIAPVIRVPANVRSVMFWRQNRNVPQGHRFIADSKETSIYPGFFPDGLMRTHTHQTIDNSSSIRSKILEVIS